MVTGAGRRSPAAELRPTVAMGRSLDGGSRGATTDVLGLDCRPGQRAV